MACFSVKFASSLNSLQSFIHRRLVCLTIPQNCCLHKQKSYENLTIPTRPKRPASPFLKFMAHIRPTLVKEYPEKKTTELSKVVSQKWSEADLKLKEKLSNEYHDEITEYIKLKQEYVSKLTPEQIAFIELERKTKIEAKENREKKKKIKTLGKPKLPVSPFLRFLQSKKQESPKYASHRDWVKGISEQWRNLKPEEKSQIQEEYKQERAQWTVELKKWEEKMIKDGHLDVVRKGSLHHEPTRKMKKT